MSECSYHYITSVSDFCVNGKLIDSNEVNNRFIFYKSDGITFSEAGFFRNGFRNAKWQYDASGDLKTIEWAYFKDSATMVETNVFSYADSVKYEPGRCKLKFLTDAGYIILSMTVNGLLRDSSPEVKYKDLVIKELNQIHVNVLKVQSTVVEDFKHTIFLHDFTVRSDTSNTNQLVTIKSGFCRLSKDLFFEFSVRYNSSDLFLGEKLFDAVLTSTYIQKKRMYFPFRRVTGK